LFGLEHFFILCHLELLVIWAFAVILPFRHSCELDILVI